MEKNNNKSKMLTMHKKYLVNSTEILKFKCDNYIYDFVENFKCENVKECLFL